MGKIDSAIVWMVELANNNTHGYDQTNRWGPDYDCASAVITAWENAGVPVKTNGATYTGDMLNPFLKSGFIDVKSSITLSTGSGLVAGDVLLKPKTPDNSGGHTAMYIGLGNMVHAFSNENGKATGGQTGDQTGKEILIESYNNKSDWKHVLRYQP